MGADLTAILGALSGLFTALAGLALAVSALIRAWRDRNGGN